MTLKDIADLTGEYAVAYDKLATAVTNLNDQIEGLKRQHLGAIKRMTAAAATRKAALHTAIASAPELFAKPRTHIFSEIKVGLAKQRGCLDFDDSDTVVARIKKIYGDQADSYINRKETPDKTALEKLPACDLKKLGCELTKDSDKVVINPVAGDVEKVVAALLKDATAETLAAMEAA